MSKIPGKNTSPEIAVRSLLHRLGYRFSLHRKDLPGKPDIVLPMYATAIFVNGCFWHRHSACKFAYTPKTNVSFWLEKFKNNVARDKRAKTLLKEKGWKVLYVWECELRKPYRLERKLTRAIKQVDGR